MNCFIIILVMVMSVHTACSFSESDEIEQEPNVACYAQPITEPRVLKMGDTFLLIDDRGNKTIVDSRTKSLILIEALKSNVK